MPEVRSPRRGSMQIWPRKRVQKTHTRIRAWTQTGEAKALGFAGYKAGMTHVIITDSKKTSMTKGLDISIPVTVIECPPIKVAGIRFYKMDGKKKLAATEVLSSKMDKELSRRIPVPKKIETEKQLAEAEKDIAKVTDIRLLVSTQPKLTGIGKKRPELFEMAIGGEVSQQLTYAKSVLGNELNIEDVFKPGLLLDVHSITKGKGYQGPVKRFGVAIRQAKSEKTKRGPGSLGPWHPHHGNYRVAHAGQMGYFSRMEKNKKLIMISNDPKVVNPDGGFLHYGLVKNKFILVEGSVAGTANRMIKLTFAQRKNKKISEEAMAVQYVSTGSKQGK